jgi:putative oxidoreductase
MHQRNFGDVAVTTARVVFAGVFLVNAAGLSADFPNVSQLMAGKGIPAAGAALAVTIAAWAAGGLCLLAGYRLRWTATSLAVLMLPVTVGMHAPWAADPASFQNELNHFLKNLGFIAGLLALAAAPAAEPGRVVHPREATS